MHVLLHAAGALSQIFVFVYRRTFWCRLSRANFKVSVLFLDLLSHLLTKAFESYDMENLIMAFLIARQAALEGPAVFTPYSEWFKVR